MMGSKERREREKALLKLQREREIAEAAEALFLQKGFKHTTIGDIAKACEMTNGAIYLYYKNKDELILITMTNISLRFGEMMKEKLDDKYDGWNQVKACLDLYRQTFTSYEAYHVLDAQFNALYHDSYPHSPRLDDYFSANKKVFNTLLRAFSKGVEDGTLTLPVDNLERSVHMVLNVINSFVEKLSLRRELMEREQNISLKEELNDFLDFLESSLSGK